MFCAGSSKCRSYCAPDTTPLKKLAKQDLEAIRKKPRTAPVMITVFPA